MASQPNPCVVVRFVKVLILLQLLAGLVGGGSPMSAFAQAVPARPFNMVSLGDSIIWGQGLPESMKFRTLVANWLQSQYGTSRSVVQWPTRAHSGAVTGWGLYPPETNGNDPDSWYMTNPSAGYSIPEPYPGEVPFGYPSISFQIGMTVNDLRGKGLDPGNVDLVLLDGCINDLSVKNILNPALVETNVLQGEIANGPNWVRTKTNELCVTHMQSLLPQVIGQFPNAVVIMTGYFPIVSGSTDLFKLAEYLSVLGLAGGAGPPAAGIIGGPGAALDYLVGVPAAAVPVSAILKATLADRSQAFATTAFNGLSNLVTQANQGLATPRAGLAWPNFSDDNAYAGPNSYLFLIEDFLSDEVRGGKGQAPPGDWNTPEGVAYYRAQECSHAHPSDPTCYAALMGHPNPAGAQAYAAAIINVLQGVFTTKLGLPQPKTLFTRFSSGTDTNGPYVYIRNRPNEPPQVNNYSTQVPTWIQVNAVDGSNNPVQGNVAVGPIPPPYWPFFGQSIEAFDFGVLSNGFDTGLAVLPNGSYTEPGEPTGRKIYYLCLPAGTPVIGPNGRPSNLTTFPGNQQGCSVQVSAPGYITCVLQLGPVPAAPGGLLGGLFGGGVQATGPSSIPQCPAAPAIGRVATAPNYTIANSAQLPNAIRSTGPTLMPMLSASVCLTSDGKTCLPPNALAPAMGQPRHAIVVVSSGGQPVGGAAVSVSGQNGGVLTNASGVGVVTYNGCIATTRSPVGIPVAMPTPCQGAAAKSGYQSVAISLP